MYNYTSYVERISANKQRGMFGKAAVDEAMNWAIHENLLDGVEQGMQAKAIESAVLLG